MISPENGVETSRKLLTNIIAKEAQGKGEVSNTVKSNYIELSKIKQQKRENHT